MNNNVQKLLFKMIENRFKEQTKSKRLSPKHYQDMSSIEQKLVKLQDLYLDGEFDRHEYKDAKSRYSQKLNALKEKQENWNNATDVLSIYKNGLKKLENFDKQFTNSDIEHKRKLLGSIFPEKFQFENQGVRTKDINPLLLKIASVNNGLKENKKGDKSKNDDLSRLVQAARLELAHLAALDPTSSVSTNSTTPAQGRQI